MVLGGESYFDKEKNLLEEQEEEEVEEEEGEGEDDVCGEFEDYGDCYDVVSLQEDKKKEKKFEKEIKIRNYLKMDGGENNISEHSFLKRINLCKNNDNNDNNDGGKDSVLQQQNVTKSGLSSITEHEGREEEEAEDGEEDVYSTNTGHGKINIINCEAIIYEPNCQLSASVIQLPSTPCSSFSLYRFFINGFNNCFSTCCLYKKLKNEKNKNKFEASFEFNCYCPQIKFEPQSGYFKMGEVYFFCFFSLSFLPSLSSL